MIRAGGEWLHANDVETAAEVFSAAMLLAAAETVNEGTDAFLGAVVRPAIAAFRSANDGPAGAADMLQRSMARQLRRRFGTSARALLEVLSAARGAVMGAIDP